MIGRITGLIDHVERILNLGIISKCNGIITDLKRELDNSPNYTSGFESNKLNQTIHSLCEFAELQHPRSNEMDVIKVILKLILFDQDTLGQDYIIPVGIYLTKSTGMVMFDDRRLLECHLKKGIKSRSWKIIYLLSIIGERSEPARMILAQLLVQNSYITKINQLLMSTSSVIIIQSILKLLNLAVLSHNPKIYKSLLGQMLPANIPRDPLFGSSPSQNMEQNYFIYARHLAEFNISKRRENDSHFLPLRGIKFNGNFYQNPTVLIQTQSHNRMHVWYPDAAGTSIQFVELFLDNLTELEADENITRLGIRLVVTPGSVYQSSGINYQNIWRTISILLVFTQINSTAEKALYNLLKSLLTKSQSTAVKKRPFVKLSSVSTVISLHENSISSDDDDDIEILNMNHVVSDTDASLPPLKPPLLATNHKPKGNSYSNGNRKDVGGCIPELIVEPKWTKCFEPHSSPPLLKFRPHKDLSLATKLVGFSQKIEPINDYYRESTTGPTTESTELNSERKPFEPLSSPPPPLPLPQHSRLRDSSMMSTYASDTSHVASTSFMDTSHSVIKIDQESFETANIDIHKSKRPRFESFNLRLQALDESKTPKRPYTFDNHLAGGSESVVNLVTPPSLSTSVFHLKIVMNQLNEKVIRDVERCQAQVALKPRLITQRVCEILQLHQHIQRENRQRLVEFINLRKRAMKECIYNSITTLTNLEKSISSIETKSKLY